MSLRTRPIADAIVMDETTHGGTRLIEYQPGNGTRYVVLFQSTSAWSQEALDRLGWQEGTVLISVLNFQQPLSPYPAAPHGFIHFAYLRDKMKLGNDADARVLAELIAHVVPGRQAESAAENEQH
jgi:hypothetical protein